MTLSQWITLVGIFAYSLSVDQLDELYGPPIHVSVVFRHGLRTPKGTYPNDPYGDQRLWARGLGELTKEGVYQQYILGSWLRLRYAHLLPSDGVYNASAIYVMSSDEDRCIMSALANMEGMFPNFPSANGKAKIAWFPVPIHTIPKNKDDLMSMKRPCKNYDRAKDAFRQSSEFQIIRSKYRNILQYTSYWTGWKMTPERMVRLFDNLLIQSTYGLTLPEWTSNFFPDSPELRELVGVMFGSLTWTPEMKRFRAGALLNRLIENMTGKLNGSRLENISVFSGHDTTVASLLHTLGVFDYVHPPFAAAVLVELRVAYQRIPFVMIYYKNSLDPGLEPVPLCLPGCACPCPLENVMRLWEPFRVRDWDQECGNEDDSKKRPGLLCSLFSQYLNFFCQGSETTGNTWQ